MRADEKSSSYTNTHITSLKKDTQIQRWTSRSSVHVLIHRTTSNTLMGHVQNCLAIKSARVLSDTPHITDEASLRLSAC